MKVRLVVCLGGLLALLAACTVGAAEPVRPASVPLPAPSATLPPPTPTATASPTPTATPIPSPMPSPTPYGCLKPPEDYTRVTYGEHVINRRTEAMLEHAQGLYGGPHDFLLAITQGSYHPGVLASFGTHDGGGAVDLTVRDLQDWHHILYEDLDAIILALRQAGFAAWVRYEGDLSPGSPIHIHAIAIGDAELSPAAREQLTGESGYFRGFDGLPVDPPRPDRHGAPYVCPWMVELGYRDLRIQGR